MKRTRQSLNVKRKKIVAHIESTHLLSNSVLHKIGNNMMTMRNVVNLLLTESQGLWTLSHSVPASTVAKRTPELYNLYVCYYICQITRQKTKLRAQTAVLLLNSRLATHTNFRSLFVSLSSFLHLFSFQSCFIHSFMLLFPFSSHSSFFSLALFLPFFPSFFLVSISIFYFQSPLFSL
jgi:hypothetical protein